MNEFDDIVWGNLTLDGMTHEQMMSEFATRIAANKIKAKDPKWLEKITAVCKALPQQENWQTAFGEYIRKRSTDEQYAQYWEWRRAENIRQSQDPEYRAAVQRGCRKRSDTEAWKQAHKKAMSSDSKRQRHSEAIGGANHPMFKGYTYGLNEATGEQVRFVGNKEMLAAGYQPSGVCNAIKNNGRYKQMKWWRAAE